MSPKFPVRIALMAMLAASLGLAGCGRRGPLEYPADARAKASPADVDGAASKADGANAAPKRRANGPTPPHEPFILDPLL